MTYRLYSKPQPMSVLPRWEGNVGPFTHLVGHTLLGHFIVTNPETNEYGVVHPFAQAFKSYGQHESRDVFQSAVLDDPGFTTYVLQPELQAEVAARIGEVEGMEVFYPVPYPIIGGSGAADTYDRGNFVIFAELVAQILGLEGRPS